jgi:hexosaminidase
MRLLTICILSCLTIFSPAQYDANRYPIIPKPQTILTFSGEFTISRETIIITDKKHLRKECDFFLQQLKSQYGLDLKFGNKNSTGPAIFITDDSSGVPSNGYQLFVNRNEINLYGNPAGIFYGLQSLLQLIHENYKLGDNTPPVYTIPSCSIIDFPQFEWRGLHLDVSRHFFPKENVKEYLRWMAMYKLNTFHWHLTDDQGWRIEIKKYPKLTSVGAWRSGTLMGHYTESPDRYDGIRHGGYYTQDEIREVVRYADSLHITIVPEIEMPGHACAMLAAYPELGCTEGPFDVQKTWGVFDDVLCPKEETFTFLDNVLTEVAALFPGKYIHIGGDECPKTRWKESAFCQNLIKEKKLQDEHELQSWFVKRIVKLLSAKGKQAIGWDEILEGGLAEGAAVMSWRGEAGGIAAAKAGHYVVMSPGSHCYFDHYQSQNNDEPLAIGGYLPLERVYSYYPVPAILNESEKKFILGAQANVWTEYIPDWKQVQYMLFPRLFALAEVNWTDPSKKNFADFSQRMQKQMTRLDEMKINYAKSYFDVSGVIKPTSLDALGLVLSCADTGCLIRYSINNNYLDKIYDPNFPIIINESLTIFATAEKKGLRIGKVKSWQFDYNLATGKPISIRKQPAEAYNYGGPNKLLDGQKGATPWKGSDWLGWSGDTLDVIIDLGKDTLVKFIEINYLLDHSSWIYKPEGVVYEYSQDGVHFYPFNMADAMYISSSNDKIPESGIKKEGLYLQTPVQVRYVHIILCAKPKIPSGNPGEGNPAWLFISEIEVK